MPVGGLLELVGGAQQAGLAEVVADQLQAHRQAAGAKAGLQMRTQARKEVDEAVDAMKKRGLQVHTPNPEQMKEWNTLAEQLYPRIRGKMVPAETFDEVMKLLKDYRAGKR